MNKTDVSKPFELNQSTLVKKIKVARPPPISKNAPLQALGSKAPVFSQKEESELVDYVQQLQKILFRLTIYDVRSLAEQLLKNNNKDTKLRTNHFAAGQQWVLGFLKRYPKVTLRIPPSNTTPAMGFDMAELKYFYETLGQLYELENITPDRIYYTNDLEISTVAKDNKTFITTGNKTTAYRSVSEKETITSKICVDANGRFMPSMMVLSAKNFEPDLLINITQEIWVICNDTGVMRTESFAQWLRKFIIFSGAKNDRPVLLLFDGQTEYIRSIDIIKTARENGIIMISFPPHTRHLLQPLNEEFINSLNMCYVKEVNSYLQSNSEETISTAQVVDLFYRALNQAATSTNTTNRFKHCGIFPLDSTVFKESDFIPPVSNKVQVNEQKSRLPTKTTQDSLFTTPSRYYYDLYTDPKPGCSFWLD